MVYYRDYHTGEVFEETGQPSKNARRWFLAVHKGWNQKQIAESGFMGKPVDGLPGDGMGKKDDPKFGLKPESYEILRVCLHCKKDMQPGGKKWQPEWKAARERAKSRGGAPAGRCE